MGSLGKPVTLKDQWVGLIRAKFQSAFTQNIEVFSQIFMASMEASRMHLPLTAGSFTTW
jgi:hypothetical protein